MSGGAYQGMVMLVAGVQVIFIPITEMKKLTMKTFIFRHLIHTLTKSRMEAYKKYCIVRSSVKLRMAIRHRLKERGLTDYKLCQKLGIPRSNFSNFMSGDSKVLSQYSVLRIAEELGIDIVIDIKFK